MCIEVAHQPARIVKTDDAPRDKHHLPRCPRSPHRFVPSTLYGPLPDVIREFREAAAHAQVPLIEMFTLEQLAALRGGRIDIGVGRLCFDDDALTREVLVDEPLIAALPEDHPLASIDEPLTLANLARETLIVYPGTPRPSYADQQLSAFKDAGSNRPRFTRCVNCRLRSVLSLRKSA